MKTTWVLDSILYSMFAICCSSIHFLEFFRAPQVSQGSQGFLRVPWGREGSFTGFLRDSLVSLGFQRIHIRGFEPPQFANFTR